MSQVANLGGMMKVVVFGRGEAPSAVRAVQTAQVTEEDELYYIAHQLSGGEFVIVILSKKREATALSAARVAVPVAKVVLARNGQLHEVVAVGDYRSFTFAG